MVVVLVVVELVRCVFKEGEPSNQSIESDFRFAPAPHAGR